MRHTDKGRDLVKIEVEIGVIWPQAKGCLELLGAGRGRKDPPLGPPEGVQSFSDFWLPECEGRNFHCLKPLVFGPWQHTEGAVALTCPWPAGCLLVFPVLVCAPGSVLSAPTGWRLQAHLVFPCFLLSPGTRPRAGSLWQSFCVHSVRQSSEGRSGWPGSQGPRVSASCDQSV